MSEEIVYLKLVNGDELFAKLTGTDEDVYLLEDVMVMETVGDPNEVVKYLFMTRYSPYSNSHSLVIAKKQVIFLNDVNDVIKTHYEMSLAYATLVADSKFLEGISEASAYLEAILKKDQDESISENILVDSSSTKH